MNHRLPARASGTRGALFLPLILLLSACAGFRGAATPTPEILMACTPPACQTGEHLVCPGQCPGGCGYVCASVDQLQGPGRAVNYLPLILQRGQSAPAQPLGPQPETQQLEAGAGGQGAGLRGNLRSGKPMLYILRMNAGQTLTIRLLAPNAPVAVTVLEPNNRAIGRSSGEFYEALGGYETRLDTVLPQTGQYRVELAIASAASAETPFELEFMVAEGSVGPPTGPQSAERVLFQPGQLSAGLTGELQPSRTRSYLLGAARDQLLIVVADAPGTPLTATIRDSAGTVLATEQGSYDDSVSAFRTPLSVRLPETGDYVVELSMAEDNPRPTMYTITFIITP